MHEPQELLETIYAFFGNELRMICKVKKKTFFIFFILEHTTNYRNLIIREHQL